MVSSVQSFRELGLGISQAVRAALQSRGLNVQGFAVRYGIRRQLVSRALAGKEAPTERLLGALIAELGGDRQAWRTLLHEAGDPAAAAIS